ncbi:hypothetical protein LMG28140_02998 [Paraburkholderia metrosideri]|jgi:hypothetical protein|uniref:Uncharacterized protein n=1 Tax=Paraburkholderia metrosideri TaxID=580937 RepID=A0ABN7HT74_9BURK|nr:hypothetical protein LMG28140_02998 [Paraburkholderia metrosideri]
MAFRSGSRVEVGGERCISCGVVHAAGNQPFSLVTRAPNAGPGRSAEPGNARAEGIIRLSHLIPSCPCMALSAAWARSAAAPHG